MSELNPSAIHFDDNIKINMLNKNTQLTYDTCSETKREHESRGPGNYKVSNLNSCDCGIPSIVKVATKGPSYSAKQFRDGYGWSACNIDDDSKLRTNKLTNVRCLNSLDPRFTLTTPFLGRGNCDAELEIKLKPGEDTYQPKLCNALSGKDMTSYHMIPMIDCLQKNVQNPKNIIEEDNGWVRSGMPSRQLIRNREYLNKCGFSNKNQ